MIAFISSSSISRIIFICLFRQRATGGLEHFLLADCRSGVSPHSRILFLCSCPVSGPYRPFPWPSSSLTATQLILFSGPCQPLMGWLISIKGRGLPNKYFHFWLDWQKQAKNRAVLNMPKKRFSLLKVGTSCFALGTVLRCCELSTV